MFGHDYNSGDSYWKSENKKPIENYKPASIQFNIRLSLGMLTKTMVSHFINHDGDIEKTIKFYRESFLEILEVYTQKINDIFELYYWMNIPTASLMEDDLYFITDIKEFLPAYTKLNLSDDVLRKILIDLFTGKFKTQL